MDQKEITKQEENIVSAETGLESKKANNNIRMFLFGLVGLIGSVVIISAAVGIYRVYAKVSTDKFTVTVAKVLHLPAFKVDDQRVLYSDYVDDLKAIQQLQKYEKENGGTTASLSDKDLSDQVLWRLLNNILVNKAAKTYNVKVESKDMDSLKNQVLQQFKDTTEAESELKKRYGWDMKTYEKKVMQPYVLQSKIDSLVQSDQKSQAEVYNLASKVLQEIKSGANFASSAVKYGEDGTASSGGDLGWFKKGVMVQEFETAAFALKKGEMSQTLVQTQYGYHIIKVTDKRTSKEKDSSGKEASVDETRASHILFRAADINWYLDKLAKQAKIHLYIKVNDPFKDILTKKTT